MSLWSSFIFNVLSQQVSKVETKSGANLELDIGLNHHQVDRNVTPEIGLLSLVSSHKKIANA